MKLFCTVKDQKGVRTYFCGLKIYEERKLEHARKTYICNIKVKKKSLVNQNKNVPANLLMQQKIDWQTRFAAAEQKILSLGLYYKDLPKDQRYVLCFDYLEHPYAEAIDAWTFFQYLQKQGIRSKYVIRKENGLFKKLKELNQLKDIISVSSEWDLLASYPEIIAQSHLVVCSFNFELSRTFKQLPFLRFIFIEHGVTLLTEWTTLWYNGDKFDGKVIPTVPTKRHYERLGFNFETCKPYYCGMPRWDNLAPAVKDKKERKIFIFFTGRLAFRKGREKRLENRAEYIRRILSFVNRLKALFAGRDDVKLYISFHHSLFEHDNNFDGEQHFQDINVVPMTEISTMVREADMCITDFSSISFDFLYRNVPVIYYCFDTDVKYPYNDDLIEQYANKIDQELYNCCRDENAAVAKVKHYSDHNFELEPEYIKRNDEIFWQRGNNCELLWKLLNE